MQGGPLQCFPAILGFMLVAPDVLMPLLWNFEIERRTKFDASPEAGRAFSPSNPFGALLILITRTAISVPWWFLGQSNKPLSSSRTLFRVTKAKEQNKKLLLRLPCFDLCEGHF